MDANGFNGFAHASRRANREGRINCRGGTARMALVAASGPNSGALVAGRQAFVALMLLLGLIASPCLAQTISPTTALVLGNVAEGSVATTFTVDSAGTVTRSPNNSTGATRVLATAAPTPTITINCPAPTAQCDKKPIQVRIASTSSSARLTLLQWLPGSFTYSGCAQTVAPSGSTVVTFTVQCTSSSSTMTFKLGHSMTVSASGTTGNADLSYRITRDYTTAPTSGGTTGTLRTTIFRGISIDWNRDLIFGKMFRPTGSATVTIDPTTGARTFSGAVVLINDATTGRAQFTTSGEGGRSVTISVPSNIVMTRELGSETISFTPTTTGAGGTTLSGSLGGVGTRVTGIGGTLSLDGATVGGIYGGTVTVTASYN